MFKLAFGHKRKYSFVDKNIKTRRPSVYLGNEIDSELQYPDPFSQWPFYLKCHVIILCVSGETVISQEREKCCPRLYSE